MEVRRSGLWAPDSITNNKSRQECFRLKHESCQCQFITGHKIRHSYDIKQKECITREGTPGNSWWGGACRFSKSSPDFRPKNVPFRTRFQTRPLKSIPVFRPGLQAEILLSLLRLERKQKKSSNTFRIRKFLFLSYSIGIETINTFILSRSSLKNHTRFQT